MPPRIRAAKSSAINPMPVMADIRITGSKLQARRLRLWVKDPHCAICRKLCDFPGGFELDHKWPLYQGGPDTDDNCQVLCVSFDVVDGRKVKLGCHARKTVEDAKN